MRMRVRRAAAAAFLGRRLPFLSSSVGNKQQQNKREERGEQGNA